MPQHAGDRRAPIPPPPDRRVAPRMTLLAGGGLAAGIALGAFAAIVTLVAGLALLALDAERHARAASRVLRDEAWRRRMQTAATAASDRARSALRHRPATRRRQVPRTTP